MKTNEVVGKASDLKDHKSRKKSWEIILAAARARAKAKQAEKED